MASQLEVTTDTLSLLEERLRILDFALNGDQSASDHETQAAATTSETKGPAIARLKSLERSLHSLAAKSTTVNDVLSLHARHPDLFHVRDSTNLPISLQPASLLSLVLANSQLYLSLSSKLPQLQETSIPDPAWATRMVALGPRIEKALAKQDSQASELADLRLRSAKVVESWYESGVLGMGERWADWEERLRAVEIAVRRREAAKKRDEAPV